MATQRNYAQQMDAVLATLGDTRPRLLLHACCGPCSSAVLEQLCRYFEITVLYYNPNTWPAAEYYRRGEELQKFVAAAHPLGVTVVEDTYDPQQFYTAVAGLENEPERGSRCTVCYRLRMRRAAQYARDNGFDWFTTTPSARSRPSEPVETTSMFCCSTPSAMRMIAPLPNCFSMLASAAFNAFLRSSPSLRSTGSLRVVLAAISVSLLQNVDVPEPVNIYQM